MPGRRRGTSSDASELLGDDDEEQQESNRRSTRLRNSSSSAKSLKEDSSDDEEGGDDMDVDHEENDDDDASSSGCGGAKRRGRKPRRSSGSRSSGGGIRRTRSSSRHDDDDDSDDDSSASPAPTARRKSSRSTKFSSSMKEPSVHSIADLLGDITAVTRGGAGRKSGGGSSSKAGGAGGGKRKSKKSGTSDDNSDEDGDDEGDNDDKGTAKRVSQRTRGGAARRTTAKRGGSGSGSGQHDSPTKTSSRINSPGKLQKSPAARHTSKRHRKKLEVPVSDYDDSSSESAGDETEGSGDENEEEEFKIQRIIASRSETRREWRKICDKINTSEIDNGSRWFQDDDKDENKDGGGEGGGSSGEDTFEERFLVKWADMSYLHCSWEDEQDLLDQIEGSKTYLTTFFRKSVNGLLFDADERGDGEYFDPSWTQIERVLEVHVDPEPEGGRKKKGNEGGRGKKGRGSSGSGKKEGAEDDESSSPIAKYGIVLDKNHPDYEEGTGRQFLIKWCNAPYSDCTYEFERDLIVNDVEYLEQVEAFEKRNRKPNKADMKKALSDGEEQMRRLYKIFGDKVKMTDEEKEVKVKEYQDQMAEKVFANGGQLRDYQVEGVSWLMSNHVNKRSSILADEMGLGKTIQTAVYVNTVAEQLSNRGPFLIVAPLSTIPHWQREFTGWTNLNTIVYHGSAADREYMRELEFAYETDRPDSVGFNQSFLRKCHARTAPKWQKTWMAQVIITTPEMLVTDDFGELTSIKWEILVVDEAHRLKNHSSKLASNLRDDRFDFRHTLLLTGTPIQNNMSEMWTLLNIIDPKSFDNVDIFLEKYGDIKSKERVDELHETIRPYILRRLKEDVEKSVPPKEETLIEVELTVLQKQYYRALYEKNVQFLHRHHKKALDGPSINNLAMQLRKCCNHPFLLKGVEDEVKATEKGSNVSEGDFLVKASGKLVLLDKLLPRLKEGGHRVLIFSQFKIMLDILEDYLALRQMKAERIDGSITGAKRQMAIDRFQADAIDGKEASFVMLLSTRAGGVGINLTAADTCIIFDSDWNPQNDLQAQARCHRIGQTKSVKVYRLLSRKSYEMQMFHMSSLKMGLDQAVLQGIEGSGKDGGPGAMTKEEVERLLRHGAYDIFNEEKSGASEAESNEFVSEDIDSILERRSKKVIHENTGSHSGAAGGTFSKASFKAARTNADDGSGDVPAEDVDIDDPDFWKKMVGEARVEDDDADLAGKKRKRKHANYSERDYEKRINESLMSDGGQAEASSESSADEDSDAAISCSDDDDDSYSSDLKNETLRKMGEEKKMEKKQRERSRWGGKLPTEWNKDDCEQVLKALQTYGYSNVPMDLMVNKMEFVRNNYSNTEIKRMCWALALLALREAVDDDVQDVSRRAERMAEKKRESEDPSLQPPASADGGVLAKSTADVNTSKPSEGDSAAVASSASGTDLDGIAKSDSEGQLQKSFEKIWTANKAWAVKAIEDANAFAKDNVPRSESAIEKALAGGEAKQARQNKVLPPLTAAFHNNIWPALRSRGWKEDEVTIDGKNAAKRYVFNGESHRSVSAVLDVAPVHHPELANTVESVIQSVAAEGAAVTGVDESTDSAEQVDTLFDPSTLTADSLTDLLQKYGPLQLLKDRTEPTKIKLGRRMLTTLVYLHTAHSLVSLADSKSAKTEDEVPAQERVEQLTKLLRVEKKAALPHPSWNLKHDAALIRAIVKHGWIDRESHCRAITEDKTIRWGLPFDGGEQSLTKDLTPSSPATEDSSEETQENREMADLKMVAMRAAKFLNVNNDTIEQMKGFGKQNVVSVYGLTLVGQDDGEEDETSQSRWECNEDLLLGKGNSGTRKGKNDTEYDGDGLAELPTRKDLLKRIKLVLAASSAASLAMPQGQEELPEGGQDAASKSASVSHQFTVLDQSKRLNLFLAELLRGLVKVALTRSGGLKLIRKLLDEAGMEVQHLRSVAISSRDSSAISDLKQIQDHIDLFSRNFKQSTRQSKNVLRVILGLDPMPPKSGGDLFPSQLTVVSKKKTQKKAPKVSAAGDLAINKALAAGFKDTETEDNLALRLTSMETLILSVVCSQGLPVWGDDWNSLVYEDSDGVCHQGVSPGSEYLISWFAMGGVILAAAEVWLELANERLDRKVKQCNALEMTGVTPQEKENLLKEIEELRDEVKMKEITVSEAKSLNDNPETLAKKVLMLFETVRLRMGQIDVSQGGGKKMRAAHHKSENGLGPRVLRWCSKELERWARSLEILDENGRPVSSTVSNVRKDHPHLYRPALLGKQGCRTIFIQVAQQTRLRSIFIKNGLEKMSTDLIPKASKQSRSSGDVWEMCPNWWNESNSETSLPCKDDSDLLAGILDFGYSGFEEMLKNGSFRKRLEEERRKCDGDQRLLFTRASVQQRVNHLTRELNGIEETADVLRMAGERAKRIHATSAWTQSEPGNGPDGTKRPSPGANVQTHIDALFQKSQKNGTSKGTKPPPVVSVPESDSDVEVIDITESDDANASAKRKSKESDHEADESPEKKQKLP